MELPDILYYNNDSIDNVQVLEKYNDKILTPKLELVEANSKLVKGDELTGGNIFVEFVKADNGEYYGYMLHSEEVYKIRKEKKLKNHYYGVYVREL